jgi:hypothetical protein
MLLLQIIKRSSGENSAWSLKNGFDVVAANPIPIVSLAI